MRNGNVADINKLSPLSSISKEEAGVSGVLYLPGAQEIKAYREEGFLVSDYRLYYEKKSGKTYLLLQKWYENIAESVVAIYAGMGWSMNQPIKTDEYISLSGEKPDASLYLVVIPFIINKNPYVILHNAITFH